MADRLSTYGANLALYHLLYRPGHQLWLALHSSDPGASGITDPGTTEVNEGAYVRQKINFSSPTSRSSASTNGQNFTLPATTITHLGVWSASSGGNFVLAVELAPHLSAANNSTFVVTAGDIAVSL